jgi:predicted PurR-regulated permease PerM
MTFQKVEISYKTIVFTVFFLLGLKVVYDIRQILLLLFISLILTSSLNPIVDSLERLRIPRPLGIAFTYIAIIVILILSVVGIAPLVISQTIAFSQKIPEILHRFESLGVGRSVISAQLGQLWSVPLDILRITVDIFSNILNSLLVAVITFYLLLERKKLDQHLSSLFGKEKSAKAKRVVEQLEKKLGGWVRGEAILMISVGLLNFLGFKALGMEFALPLGVLAGFLEIIPNVGPIIAGIVAIIGGLAISPMIAVAAFVWAFIVQQLEAHLLVPKVMQSATGVHPLISIVSLLIGLKLGGTAGAILAIPMVLVTDILVREYLVSQKSIAS